MKFTPHFIVAMAFLAALAAALAAWASATQPPTVNTTTQPTEYIVGVGQLRTCNPPPACIRRTDSVEQMAACVKSTKAYCEAQIRARMGAEQ